MPPFWSKLATWALCAAVTACCPTGAAASDCHPDQGRVQAGTACLVIKVHAAPAGPGRALALIVHGDGQGFLEAGYLERLDSLAQRLAQARPGDGVVFVQRPGYRSPLGRSEGRAKRQDDDYTAENVHLMAAALKALREAWQPGRAVWIGHSGGAALGALVLGRAPGLTDAAVLAGCPCGPIAQWRAHRNQSRGRPGDSLWPESLSPTEHLEGLGPGTAVVLLTGERDDNTLARFNEAWVERARARGADARQIVLPGVGHGGVIESGEVVRQAIRLMQGGN
jgi:pimeloyl-ACP methyl ester carboxylesterase